MMALANPAPPRMSSMAYGPPDTIKNVAAISGTNRIFRPGILGPKRMIVNLSTFLLAHKPKSAPQNRVGMITVATPYRVAGGTNRQMRCSLHPTKFEGTHPAIDSSGIIRLRLGEMAEWLKAAVC